MKNTDKLNDIEKWYDNNNSIYNDCAKSVKDLLEKILSQKGIPFHSIEYRVKTKNSFLEKCKKDKYDDPVSQITDICGLRIIGYTNHDIVRMQEVVESEFEIDKPNSVNKSELMNEDQVGYRSVHYVAAMNDVRLNLTEYEKYKDIKFEIQIRTLLQHAWAEIEHDRNYKFSGELPSEIKRRFYLVAGSLELLDREFEQISLDIDTYAQNIREEAKQGNLDEPINSTSLMEYLLIKFKDIKIQNENFCGHDKEIISELSAFGIKTLNDLDVILTDEMSKTISGISNYNFLGVLRDMMLINNPQKYFEQVWKHDWIAMEYNTFKKIAELNPDIEKYSNQLHISQQ